MNGYIFERAIVYSSDAVQACRQVLNDVVFYLKDYADKFYLIGGWAVYYLLDRPDRTPEAEQDHASRSRSLSRLVRGGRSLSCTTQLPWSG